MVRKSLLSLYLVGLFIFIAYGGRIQAQESPDLHVVVNLVQLNVAVTDNKGNYITGLRPKDFAIVEDGIQEKAATFAEGNNPASRVGELADEVPGTATSNIAPGEITPETLAAAVNGANVFVLFDTSDYM